MKAINFDFENMDNYYVIFARPGLQKFLDFLFANFNVSVWTAASKDYAMFIIEKMILMNKPERKLDYVFCSYHCKITDKVKNGTKDLSILWDKYKLPGYNKNNTYILDDYDEVYETQPDNCIIAEPFYFTHEGSENDGFLPKLTRKLSKFKKRMSTNNDGSVTKILNED
jgi:TFIIF-interacting CTD phosphatase-like protein